MPENIKISYISVSRIRKMTNMQIKENVHIYLKPYMGKKYLYLNFFDGNLA